MRNATKSYLLSAELRKSINATLPKDKADVAFAMIDHMLFETEVDEEGNRVRKERLLNEYGVPILKGTSAFDLGLFMLFVDVFNADSKTEVLSAVAGVNLLSSKKWITRLKVECMAKIDWVRPQARVRGNIGKFVVNGWGIYDYAVYSVFRPYATMVLNNYKSIHQIGNSKP